VMPKVAVARHRTAIPAMPVARRGMERWDFCIVKPLTRVRTAKETASQKALHTRSQRRSFWLISSRRRSVARCET